MHEASPNAHAGFVPVQVGHNDCPAGASRRIFALPGFPSLLCSRYARVVLVQRVRLGCYLHSILFFICPGFVSHSPYLLLFSVVAAGVALFLLGFAGLFRLRMRCPESSTVFATWRHPT